MQALRVATPYEPVKLVNMGYPWFACNHFTSTSIKLLLNIPHCCIPMIWCERKREIVLHFNETSSGVVNCVGKKQTLTKL